MLILPYSAWSGDRLWTYLCIRACVLLSRKAGRPILPGRSDTDCKVNGTGTDGDSTVSAQPDGVFARSVSPTTTSPTRIPQRT